MFYELPLVRDILERLARRFENSSLCREDLLQEASIHLWRQEKLFPGRTQSWYLQNCRFHLLNLLQAGKSIDAPKHGAGQELKDEAPELASPPPMRDDFGEMCADEALGVLRVNLTDAEQSLLNLLLEGLGTREIGRKLGISHTTVIRRRRHIACCAERLGFAQEK